MNIGMG